MGGPLFWVETCKKLVAQLRPAGQDRQSKLSTQTAIAARNACLAREDRKQVWMVSRSQLWMILTFQMVIFCGLARFEDGFGLAQNVKNWSKLGFLPKALNPTWSSQLSQRSVQAYAKHNANQTPHRIDYWARCILLYSATYRQDDVLETAALKGYALCLNKLYK